jgi:8-oxo-dGTP diphosphatase
MRKPEHCSAYHMFVVDDWSGGEPRLTGGEHSELGWFSLEEALELDLAMSAYRKVFRQLLT